MQVSYVAWAALGWAVKLEEAAGMQARCIAAVLKLLHSLVAPVLQDPTINLRNMYHVCLPVLLYFLADATAIDPCFEDLLGLLLDRLIKVERLKYTVAEMRFSMAMADLHRALGEQN